MASSARRRCFSFSLRTLLVGVTLAACSTAMGIQINWLLERHAFLKQSLVETPDQPGKSPRAPGMLWLLGEPGRPVVNIVAPTEEKMTAARRLFPEAEIRAEWLCGGVLPAPAE